MASNLFFNWLVNSALASAVLLVCGAALVRILRQPADKLRAIQWSLRATLLSLVLVSIPSFSLLSLGVLSASSNSRQPQSEVAMNVTERAPAAPLPADNSLARRALERPALPMNESP